jgi:hypothetical protein
MSRQQPVALLAPPGRLDNLVHQLSRKSRRQHTQRNPVTQPSSRLNLHLPRSWHAHENNMM